MGHYLPTQPTTEKRGQRIVAAALAEEKKLVVADRGQQRTKHAGIV